MEVKLETQSILKIGTRRVAEMDGSVRRTKLPVAGFEAGGR